MYCFIKAHINFANRKVTPKETTILLLYLHVLEQSVKLEES